MRIGNMKKMKKEMIVMMDRRLTCLIDTKNILEMDLLTISLCKRITENTGIIDIKGIKTNIMVSPIMKDIENRVREYFYISTESKIFIFDYKEKEITQTINTIVETICENIKSAEYREPIVKINNNKHVIIAFSSSHNNFLAEIEAKRAPEIIKQINSYTRYITYELRTKVKALIKSNFHNYIKCLGNLADGVEWQIYTNMLTIEGDKENVNEVLLQTYKELIGTNLAFGLLSLTCYPEPAHDLLIKAIKILEELDEVGFIIQNTERRGEIISNKEVIEIIHKKIKLGENNENRTINIYHHYRDYNYILSNGKYKETLEIYI